MACDPFLSILSKKVSVIRTFFSTPDDVLISDTHVLITDTHVLITDTHVLITDTHVHITDIYLYRL